MVRQFGVGFPERSEDAGNGNAGSALDVVVEGAVLLAVPVKCDKK